MHLRQVVLKKKISIFFSVFLWFKPSTSNLSSGGHFVRRSGTVLARFSRGTSKQHSYEVGMKSNQGYRRSWPLKICLIGGHLVIGAI